MDKLIRFTYAAVLALIMALALALGGCMGASAGHSSTSQASQAGQSASAPVSASQASQASQAGQAGQADSAGQPASTSGHASSSAAQAGGREDLPAAHVDADDDSYAQSHLDTHEYDPPDITVKRNGTYTDKDHVALYIHTYGTVPSNYVSKNKARKAGWVNTKGNLWDVLPGMSIGGGGFYNDDGMMPDAPGRAWFECDIDYEGGFRNAKRLVYSNDGLIYYTQDHYKTFQRLY